MRNLTKYLANFLTIWFRPGVVRTGGRLHLALYRLFHGAGPLGVDTLILTTRGRTSGEPRSTPLYYAEHDGNRYVAASFAGSDTVPHWYRNLVAHPQVEVDIRGETIPHTARVLPADEAKRIWPALVAIYPTFERYRQRTSRAIPVIELTPTRQPTP
ncbi:MAG: nitroreductase family deazaflavin-dependent oxidoreductase [Actinobacteria bacterium]|nr:nitroreductase family deazaflavin-dependent oxidoreductase [Actinomycetota bacterium]